MRIETLQIRNFRGIKDLLLDLRGENVVIDGPNGSGKSGVVDAVEFVLTGRISRLEGEGTGQLSVRTHGPHVDNRDEPREAWVQATVRGGGDRLITIRRSVDKPKAPLVTPMDAVDEVRWIADHPEIALSRRELIKFILVEPGARAREIQALLKLERIDGVRRSLSKAAGTLLKEEAALVRERDLARSRVDAVVGENAAQWLDIINRWRHVLGVPALETMTQETNVAEGLATHAERGPVGQLNKAMAARDLEALVAFVREHQSITERVQTVLDGIRDLEDRGDMSNLLAKHELIEMGLRMFDGATCPLCDHDWDPVALRAHLEHKLAQSEAARKHADTLVGDAAVVRKDVLTLADHVEIMARHAQAIGDLDSAGAMRHWRGLLTALVEELGSMRGIRSVRAQLACGWAQPPALAEAALRSIEEEISKIPTPTEADEARSSLILCQERLSHYRDLANKCERLERRVQIANKLKELFDITHEQHLSRVYESIEQDLVRFYRRINDEDESSFQAKLGPKSGKLLLDVDFYGRGLFPPGAYHSEGHQDGMGLCLYLALMKQLFGERFTLGVLDDVLMSVDRGHRKRVCELLKSEFGGTQFIITTHDDVWRHQMISAGLVSKKGVKRFRGWNVDHGPLVDDYKDVWASIDEHLAKEEIPQAAALLRRHLEQVAGELCERLCASAPYRRDGNHDLGDLLPAAVGKWISLLKGAKDVALSWGRKELMDEISKREASFKAKHQATQMESWAVNRSVHYNEWANLTKADLQPVVDAYRELLAEFRCPDCESWMTLMPPKGTPEEVVCDCKAASLNLKRNPKHKTK